MYELELLSCFLAAGASSFVVKAPRTAQWGSRGLHLLRGRDAASCFRLVQVLWSDLDLRILLALTA